MNEKIKDKESKDIFIIFDEATSIDSTFWDAAELLMKEDDSNWIKILAPIKTSSKKGEINV